MRRTPEEVPGVQLFTAECFRDERGLLLEAWVRSKLRDRGIEGEFLQAVQTVSRRGVARGLHFQWAPPLAKLVRCAQGAVFDVIVDVRIGSPTLGDHVAVELSGENHRLLWVPNGFAHGFMALEERSMMFYQFTAEWSPGGEGAIRWNDEALGVSWPDIPPIVSERDQRAPTLEEWLRDPRSQNFRYGQDESLRART